MTLLNIPVDGTVAPPTIPTCATPDQAALLEWAHQHPLAKPRPDIHNGRYILPDPTTGDNRKWTRVTRFTSEIENADFAAWGESLLVRGLTLDADLWQQAQDLADDRKALEAVAAAAAQQGGRWIDADIGTALHTATEHHDLNTGHYPPAPWDAHVAAWHQMLDQHGLKILPEWVERTVVNPVVDCAGTLDRLAQLPDGRIVVLDIKTGSEVRKIGYAAQAAIYARSTHAWTPDGYQPLPDIDQDVALIAHLPAKGDGCELIEVDTRRGWAAVEANLGLRKTRGTRGVFTAVGVPSGPKRIELAPQPLPVDRSEWVTQRVDTLVQSTAAKAMLAETWPAGYPKRGPWTDEQIDTIAEVLAPIETVVEAPYPHQDPAAVTTATEPAAEPPSRPAPDDGPVVDQGDVNALKQRAALLDETRAAVCARWRTDGRLHRHPWGGTVDGAWTRRCWADNRAALLCAEHLYDPDIGDSYVRAALTIILGDQLTPQMSVGAAIGTLTIPEADQLADIAQAAATGDPEICKALALHVA